MGKSYTSKIVHIGLVHQQLIRCRVREESIAFSSRHVNGTYAFWPSFCADRLETARLPQIAASVISGKVVTVLTDYLARTLKSQHSDGSWGSIGPREEIAYAVLTLASLLSTSVAQSLRGEIVLALKRGRKYLLGLEGGKPEHIWVEKVTYGSKYLAETYVVTAMFTSVDDSGGHGTGEFCHLKACEEDNFALDPDRHNVGELLVLRDCLAKPES